MTEKEILSEEARLRREKERKKIRIKIGISIIAWLTVALAFSIPTGMILESYAGETLNLGGYLGLFLVFCICLFPIDYYIDAKFL
jgi:hypothetical protein